MSKNAKRFQQGRSGQGHEGGLVIRRLAGEGVQVGDVMLRVIEVGRGRVRIAHGERVQFFSPGQALQIGAVRVRVLQCHEGSVRLLFSGPREIPIWREEIALLIA